MKGGRLTLNRYRFKVLWGFSKGHRLQFFAAFLFGELPTPLLLFGGALILGGVFYYSRLETREGK